jgi:DNA-binding beta-propeller fold protein YncE
MPGIEDAEAHYNQTPHHGGKEERRKTRVSPCPLVLRGGVFLCVLLSLSYGALLAQSRSVTVPRFEIDPYWPKPLPDTWEMGELGAVFVDANDHIWVISRPRTLTADQIGLSVKPPTSECCVPAPPVIEFDQEGRVVQSWGGAAPGYEWPANEHGLFVDHKGNVWLGGNTANQDAQILKFTHDGKFLLQIGRAKASKGSLDVENLNRPAQIWVWEKTNEVFVADGYQNRRVIVFDADTGKFKRMWGAYGNKPDDGVSRDRVSGPRGSEQFNIVHGVSVANDGLVYVSDRVNNRIQVFRLDGTFVKEAFIARGTLDSRGTAFAVAFSPDKEQKFLIVPDGANDKVRVLDRQTLQVLDSWGRPGPYAGQWHWLHSLAIDSKGNLYTAESRGNRLQKFVNKGLKTVSQITDR